MEDAIVMTGVEGKTRESRRQRSWKEDKVKGRSRASSGLARALTIHVYSLLPTRHWVSSIASERPSDLSFEPPFLLWFMAIVLPIDFSRRLTHWRSSTWNSASQEWLGLTRISTSEPLPKLSAENSWKYLGQFKCIDFFLCSHIFWSILKSLFFGLFPFIVHGEKKWEKLPRLSRQRRYERYLWRNLQG